jgi:hypothetical protein
MNDGVSSCQLEELYILKDPPIRESTDRAKKVLSNDNPLITEGCKNRVKSGKPTTCAEKPMVIVKLQSKRANLDRRVFQRAVEDRESIAGQLCVCVKKKENSSRRPLCANIELNSPACWRFDNKHIEMPRNIPSPIHASTVNNDNLNVPPGIPCCGDSLTNLRGLVQCRDNY